ncbi:3-demethylubiquinone-9 3-methyltransferase [Posidoniimonas corsicana]|uniref:3-demethylubiquinone-9 3-methyltransferase n=1 Tax=Posidoniimonas corsicana TaxID=1938618 RepID=A0A5C5VI40_9BACT|nr:VOC family protein [Posidoniimonas corsicana]TWT38266.1 3-demethylubiquinone-9 3-methyltransferase [Posidoniimonas corsicana]
MPIKGPRVVPCLMFEDQAEQAAEFYVSVFPNSKINAISRYGEAGREIHGKTPGTALTVAFVLDGVSFTALNGPRAEFSEALSLQVVCETQYEVDHYWQKLAQGGSNLQCGWLKDRYGVSWQIVPDCVEQLIADPASSEKVISAIMQMEKIDIAALQQAAK